VDWGSVSMPIDRQLATIFRSCEEYYLTNAGRARKRGNAYKEMQKALTATLESMAVLHATLYPGYKADEEHPGYLIKLEPPAFFRVPYHVLPTFPTGDELETLWQVSRAIRSGDRSLISLSGSNVMRRIFDTVGDIDFCEYFPVNDVDGFDKIAANMDGNRRIACLRLAFAGKKWRYPWGTDRPTKAVFVKMVDSSDPDRSTMKVDYVGDVDRLGVTEITNLIIAVDESWNSAGLTKTFAAQEAPLVPIDLLPNQMNDPFEMGRYINWLTNSIEELRDEGDMRKCLKRCAALSRVVWVTGIADDIAKLVSTSTILLSQKESELAKLSAILKPLKDARSQRLSALIEQQLKGLANTLAKRGGSPNALARQRFDDQAGRIVKRLLSCVRPGDGPSSRRAA
jgi:hypothetical protein